MTEITLKEYAEKIGVSYNTVTVWVRANKLSCNRLVRQGKRGVLTAIYDEANLVAITPRYTDKGITIADYCAAHGLKPKNVKAIILRKAVRPVGIAYTGKNHANTYDTKSIDHALSIVFKRRGGNASSI